MTSALVDLQRGSAFILLRPRPRLFDPVHPDVVHPSLRS